MSDVPIRLDIVANARMPSQRAQSLQLAKTAGAFARAGAQVRLLHARRRSALPLPAGESLFSYYGVQAPTEPTVEAIPCRDWIDSVPRRLQYGPARLQELDFSRNAAERVLHDSGADGLQPLVLSREVEAARRLLRRGHRAVFLELHRLPGGRLRRGWLAEVLDRAAGVIAISEGVAEDLADLGLPAERLCVEHDGVDLERYDGSLTQAAARAAIDVPADTPLVVYTGGLLAWKGVDLAVDAARLLPHVQFVIAGGMDADVAALRRRAAGLTNVRIDGFQPPTRVLDYICAADVGLLPNRSKPAISARYTSPLKLFEYMAAGVPMVASDLPSMRALLEHGKDAVLVAPDSASELALGIRTLIEDPHARYHMSKRLRIRAPRYSWDKRARRLLDWMQARLAGDGAA